MPRCPPAGRDHSTARRCSRAHAAARDQRVGIGRADWCRRCLHPQGRPVTDPLERVRATVAAREAAGLRRWLRPRSTSTDVLDLAGNDYLGLSQDPRVTAAAAAAARTWGAGSTGSRLVTGTTELHAELEVALATFVRTEAGLVLSS